MVYQFDDVLVDEKTFRIWKAGYPVAIEPKAFEVLLFLIKHRDRVVEKNELLDEIWKDTHVSPNSLTRAVAQLRKTLGDDAREARYIETIPTRGYRFLAEVRIVETKGPMSISPSPSHPEVEGQLADVSPGQNAIPFDFQLCGLRKTPVSVAAAILILLILTWSVIFLWRSWRSWPEDAAAAVSRVTQLTTTSGVDLFPAFSPDGSMIAYSSLRGDRYELFVRQLTPGGREIQITSDDGQNIQPAWSPDGKLIAYHARNRRGIWIRPSLGGLPKQVTEFGASPDWSPDGESIVFQSDAPADLSQAAFGAMPPSTLWIVPAQGGQARPLTKPDAPGGGHTNPAWSPDCRRIFFATYDLMSSEIWSISPQGEQLTRIWSGAGNAFDPVVAPDGQSLFFSGASGNFHLWRLRLSAGSGAPIGAPVEIANTGTALARHLSVSPDGKRIAYSLLSMANNMGSVKISPSTNESTGDPTLLTQDTNYRKINQQFSPDGKTIAYSVWRMGAESEVWLMNAEGGDARVVSAEPFALLGWLPTGNQVALIAKDGSGRMLKIDATQGTQTSVELKRRSLLYGRLSPDGQQVAVHRRTGGVINTWITALGEDKLTQLTFDREMMGFPCWSRDSRFLALEMKRGDDTQIAVIPKEGGEAKQLTFEPGQHWPGGWSPDGEKIVFAKQRNSVWNIWWVSIKTKEQKQITNYSKPNHYVRFPSWSPKGDQIVYEYAETLGNLWMTELR